MNKNHLLVYGMVGDHRGGIESYLLRMNQNMSENCIFDYVIEEATCLHEEEIKSKGGDIYYIPSRVKHPFGNIVGNFSLLKRLSQKEIAVYFNLSSLSWILPIMIARIFGYKVYVHSHNADFIAANSSVFYRLVNWINKRILHHMNVRRLSCSKPATDFMFMPSDNVEMIYNAISIERFAFNEEIRKRKREELGVDDDTTLLGFVGRLQYQKNPLYLATIMQSLVNTPKVQLIAVGEGDMRGQLEDIISNNDKLRIKLLGNRTDVNELYQAMDVMLLPSYHEGLPFVIVEAQAAGLRCLVSEYVTREVDCIGAVKFLTLDANATTWHDEVLNHINSSLDERMQLSKKFQESPFDIRREALRLENILLH